MLLSDQSRASAASAIVLVTSFSFLILPALQDPLGVLFWYYLLMPVAAGACMGMFPFLSKRFGQVMDDHGHSVLWVGSV
ncbi:MAG: hypothetical protein J4G00_11500, partial [Actinomycetia bacterium]|nr:hypothetical protein [Actinomycetes bacterium]